MARVVDTAVGSSPAIDWARFDDGRTWRLERGVDFVQPAGMARRAAISWSLRHDRHVRTSVPDEDTLIVRFVE